ncbi:hypothetical protein TPHA_0E00500 [Tetrapisispora phaffii CBS 4417]|uniref:Ubiquitin carboxyl-terminal hydrolase n=1 Tax=Tetrapisispora phaffii (strain ATCC 24235 / CBS 4417 / NBRC 1672 / NRRL Y-8282 / UCD 70-5) TaxID=1071381 RepID=G8BTB8_TETPH|nr:hypothetical protein TPHA_0E00500 [Tetrapisispora phaffii CBS 4417]CCE63146.1 hypothetical protein TPHA_0E00500 [Tetrapisispora phaffii CBS 4417]
MSNEYSVIPLESNPEVFTNFARKLGLNQQYVFTDIYSLTDPDLIGFIPTPVKAIILLFPITAATELDKNTNNADVSKKPPIWFKQTVRNACGLYAILHSLSNNKDLLKEDCELEKYLETHIKEYNKYEDKITSDFVVNISNKNTEYFAEGQTSAPSAEGNVDLHYITFIEKDNDIYELDGRRLDGSKYLGKKSDLNSSNLLGESIVANRVQWYMDSADVDKKLHFSLLGLVPSWD